MKLRPRRRKASESPVREVKLRLPLKKRKEKPGARLNSRSVKSDGLVKKNVEGEPNQDEDPGPSNSASARSRPGFSGRQVSTGTRSSVPNIEMGPGSGVALLLEEVLEHIFGYLTFAEVKSARLVNKHWRQVTTSLLRRSSRMIQLDRSLPQCITKMGDGQFPVNRLRVGLFADGYAPAPENREIYLTTFPGICAWVKELTLTIILNKHSLVQVVDDMATLPTDCVYKDLTNLNLQLFQQTDLFLESWRRFTDFVRSILEKSPNLRVVNVEYRAEGTETLAICPVIENLFPISTSVGTSKLSYINFESVPLEKIDLAKWSTLNLKLRKLWLNMSCSSNTTDLLEKFLETQTGTLKDLSLKLTKGKSKQPAATFRFPKLEKLEQLRVVCNSSYAVVTFAGINYARLFPSLKKLDLRHGDRNWRDFLGNDLLEPTNTVEELIFPWTIHDAVHLIPNPAVIASKVFTGLKKLEIKADPVLIQAVYENMPNLEVLRFYISSSLIKDAIITGLEFEVCSRFRGVMTNEWIEELQNAEGRSMARLQKLKTLKLSDSLMYDRLSISWLSFHVFKKMSSLKCLDLLDGRAVTAERYSADEKQLLEELRATFVVL